jgi:hypothetical protein
MKDILTVDKLHHYTVKSDEAELPGIAIQEIKDFIGKEVFGDKFPVSKREFSHQSHHDIIWQWKTQRGKLTKRIQEFLYKNFNKKLSEKAISTIGDIARKYIPKSQDYHFDVTKNLFWSAGDFGDDSSCYYTEMFSNKNKLPSDPVFALASAPNYYALRFFYRIPKDRVIAHQKLKVFHEDDEFNYIGLSRSWFYKFAYTKDKATKGKLTQVNIDQWEHDKKEGIIYIPAYYIFNSYGIQSKLAGSILSSYLKNTTNFQVPSSGFGFYNNCDGNVIIEDTSVLIEDIPCTEVSLPYINPDGFNSTVSRSKVEAMKKKILEEAKTINRSAEETARATVTLMRGVNKAGYIPSNMDYTTFEMTSTPNSQIAAPALFSKADRSWIFSNQMAA